MINILGEKENKLNLASLILNNNFPVVKRWKLSCFIRQRLKKYGVNTDCALSNKACFLNTSCEVLNTSRCVVVTHLFTVLFHGLRKHTKACKETEKGV